MSSAVHSPGRWLFAGALVAFVSGDAAANALSPFEALATGESRRAGTPTVSRGTVWTDPAVSPFQDSETRRPPSKRGVIGLVGPLGVILDYSSGIPRMRGFALTDGEHVRLEASGRVAPDFQDVTGQLRVLFRF